VAVSSALANIALGLITSVVGGAAVWLWQRLAVRRSRRAKESFFGLARGTGCLIIFNNAAGRRGAMHHNDVQAMIEVATLGASTGSPVSVESCNDFQGLNGNRTEFCLGGPGGGSNPRTGAAAYQPWCPQLARYSFHTRELAAGLSTGPAVRPGQPEQPG